MGRALAHALSPVLGLAIVVAGCRFSAAPTDPYAGAPSATSGGAGGQGTGGSTDTGGTNGASGTDGATGASGAGGTNGAGDTGGMNGASGTDGATGATGGSTGTDSGAGGDTGSEGTGGSDGGTPSCQPSPSPAICDPVKNLGCLVPFSFCDIDPAQAVATGRCVFPWSSTPPPADGGCLADMTSSTCMPTSTCVNGSCRKICYCDMDCPSGQCCTEPAPGSSVTFKLCTPC